MARGMEFIERVACIVVSGGLQLTSLDPSCSSPGAVGPLEIQPPQMNEEDKMRREDTSWAGKGAEVIMS